MPNKWKTTRYTLKRNKCRANKKNKSIEKRFAAQISLKANLKYIHVQCAKSACIQNSFEGVCYEIYTCICTSKEKVLSLKFT